MIGAVARLAKLIPVRFAQDCASDAFVDSCMTALTQLTRADSAQAAAGILGGLVGGPLVFVGIYAGGAILRWKSDKKREAEAKERFREIGIAIRKVGEEVHEQKELAGLLDELLRRDEEMRERLEAAERGTSDPTAAIDGVMKDVFGELAVEVRDGFDGVRIYLSTMSTWMAEQGVEIVKAREGVERVEARQDEHSAKLVEISRKLDELDKRQKVGGDVRPALSGEDLALLAEAKSHGDAKSQAQAAIIAGDFEAADSLIDVVRERAASELFDALTLKGDRHYYAGECDAAIEPYEKALELLEHDFGALINVALAHSAARLGDIAAHQRRAIELCEHALTLVESGSDAWALAQNIMGSALRYLPTGDRWINQWRAIAAHEAALEVHTRDAHPLDWADVQFNLGTAYLELPTGDRRNDLRRAILAFESSLEVYTREAHPLEWAQTQGNLGIAYGQLSTGYQDEDLRRAILALESALELLTLETHPWWWARTQNDLGNVYSRILTGEPGENLQRAIIAYKSALEVYTREADPVGWACVQTNLGITYSELSTGDRKENLLRAIAFCESALEVRTRESLPVDWAQTQSTLARVAARLAELSGQDRCGLLRRAIACGKGALTVRTAEEMPHEHAITWRNLEYVRREYEAAGYLPSFDEIEPAE